jgi:hypothetical protein
VPDTRGFKAGHPATTSFDTVFQKQPGGSWIARSSRAMTLIKHLFFVMSSSGGVVGGVVPPQDYDALKAAGAEAIFPGASGSRIIRP